MAAHDLFKHHGMVTAIALGTCCSGAFTALQGAKVRKAFSNTSLMYHDGDIYGSKSDTSKEQKEEWKRLGNIQAKIIASRSKLPLRQIKKQLKLDTFLSAEEALNLGFIDGII